MAENNDGSTNSSQDDPVAVEPTKVETPTIDPEILKKAVDDQLKDIKAKLDQAYNARDEALKRSAEFEQKNKEAEIERLKAEGKKTEAMELELANIKANNEVLKKRNTELSRDISVKDFLKSYTFKTDRAFNMAWKEIIEDLTQNENGEWISKAGDDLESYIKKFAEDETNAFLFKAKASSGPGLGTPNNASASSGKSLFQMSQAEVLKLAAEGKLPRKR